MAIFSIASQYNKKLWRVSGDMIDIINGIINYTPEQVTQFIENDLIMHEHYAGHDEDPLLDKTAKVVKRTLVFPLQGIFMPKASELDKIFGFVSTLELMESLKKMVVDNIGKIDRVVLNIDSPGGSTVGGNEMANVIKEIVSSGLEVIAFSHNQMTSLGYHFASASSRIITLETAVVGSIGSIVQILKFDSGFFGRIHTFKSGDLKDVGSSTRPMDLKEMTFFDDMITRDFDDFSKFVANNRGVDLEEVVATEGAFSQPFINPWFVDETVDSIHELII